MVSSYIISLATDGPRALAMREEPEAELQGFKQVARRDDHPFYESQWQRMLLWRLEPDRRSRASGRQCHLCRTDRLRQPDALT